MKKELLDEELENVTGGMGKTDDKVKGFTGFVDQYAVEGYTNKELYFAFTASAGTVSWVKGRVVKSFEFDMGCNNTQRRHNIIVLDGDDNWKDAIGGERQLIAGNYCAYTTKL